MRQTNLVVFCRYCNLPAELVDGDLIYPGAKHLKHKPFWLCKRDNAYVGCKPDSTEPTSHLADEKERKRRQEWHAKNHPQVSNSDYGKLTHQKPQK